MAAFILFHIWQLHHLGSFLGGGEFDAEHATSSAAIAIRPLPIQIIYAVGTLCAVYHLANGLWTFGITWGLWTSEGAQRRAGYVCSAIGILLAIVGMSALYGMSTADIEKAKVYEGVHLAEENRVNSEVEKLLDERQTSSKSEENTETK
ncbi:MAG: hypothetical protein IT427_15925 [Pirellulales bacterium]|nr:hypothetical protein [Pirellulales bacterium]